MMGAKNKSMVKNAHEQEHGEEHPKSTTSWRAHKNKSMVRGVQTQQHNKKHP
jgi:hypothetical protein